MYKMKKIEGMSMQLKKNIGVREYTWVDQQVCNLTQLLTEFEAEIITV